jgi:outer membrane protein insertion porin family
MSFTEFFSSHVHHRARRLGCFGVVAATFIFSCSAIAASEESKTQREQYEVHDIKFKIMGVTPEQTFRDMMQTVESPAAFWTYIYNHIYEKLGLEPVYYDPILFDGDVTRIKGYLTENGFFHAAVDTTIRFNQEEKRVDLILSINEGRRSLIDTIKILGISQLTSHLKDDIVKGSFVKVGDPYVKNLIEQERLRILRFLENNGYNDAVVDSVVAIRYVSTNNFTVEFVYHLGRQYEFGPIQISMDTNTVNEEIVLRQIDFKTGEIYNEQKKVESEQNLNRLGLFEVAKIEPQTPIDSVTPPVIPLRIVLKSRDLQEVTPELLIDNENEAFNTGVGVGYSNRNFFGDARNLSMQARFRLQSIDNLNFEEAIKRGFSEPSLLATSDLTTQMVQPYLFSNKVSGSLTLSAEYDKQKYYTLNILRNDVGLTDKLATYTVGFADWDLERVGVDIKDTSQVNLDDFTGSRQKQFNSILTLTLQRDKTNDVFSPSEGFFHSISIEEAGTIPRLFGNLGSHLPYSEYYKITGLARQYFSASAEKSVVWAFKLKGGFAQLYDPAKDSIPVPPTRKFYAGGSGSVRGWQSQDLAAFDKPDQGGNVLLEGNIESRIPMFPHSGKFWILNLDNFWSVFFVDFGNLWETLHDVQAKEIAIASGFGLRYDTFVGPLRFDIGFRMYDPNEEPGRQWIYQRKVFKETYSVIHFGIGQAF